VRKTDFFKKKVGKVPKLISQELVQKQLELPQSKASSWKRTQQASQELS